VTVSTTSLPLLGGEVSIAVDPSVEQHSVHADRHTRQPIDIANLARQAAWDVDEGLEREQPERVIAGLRRLVAIGGLAKALADQMEAAQ